MFSEDESEGINVVNGEDIATQKIPEVFRMEMG